MQQLQALHHPRCCSARSLNACSELPGLRGKGCAVHEAESSAGLLGASPVARPQHSSFEVLLPAGSPALLPRVQAGLLQLQHALQSRFLQLLQGVHQQLNPWWLVLTVVPLLLQNQCCLCCREGSCASWHRTPWTPWCSACSRMQSCGHAIPTRCICFCHLELGRNVLLPPATLGSCAQ